MSNSSQIVTLIANGRGRSLDVRGDRRSVFWVAVLYYFNPLLIILAGCVTAYFLQEPLAAVSVLVWSSFGK